MKKRCFKHIFSCIILSIFSCNLIIAQDKIILNVVYEFHHIRDLSKAEQPYVNDMILSLGSNSSRYNTLYEYTNNRPTVLLQQNKIQEANSSSSDKMVRGGYGLLVNNGGVLTRDEINKNLINKEYTMYSFIGNRTYSLSGSIPILKWKILKEKKEIGGYVCQKALADFAGRTYEAWFTTQLPFQNGPWKLGGLPGLILEAKDVKNEVQFVFKEISRNTDPDETTKTLQEYPQLAIPVEEKQLQKLEATFIKNPLGFVKAIFPDSNIAIINIQDSDNRSIPVIKDFNPVELN